MRYANLLQAPEAYWVLDPKDKKEICNGVGPKGLGWLFPDTIWGLSVTEAANIHDYEYHVGKTLTDKRVADINFHDNMKLIIQQETWFDWLKKVRLNRAYLMYKAVDEFGESAFFADKNLTNK